MVVLGGVFEKVPEIGDPLDGGSIVDLYIFSPFRGYEVFIF